MRKHTGIAGIAAVVMLAALLIVSVANSATAVQGYPVIAGQANSASGETAIVDDGAALEETALGVSSLGSPTGIGIFAWGLASGICARAGNGSNPSDTCTSTYAHDGIHGEGTQNGVSGYTANAGASGVFGTNGDPVGNGVHGTAAGGSGVYGETTGTGNGVLGYGPTATGVKGQTTSGVGVLATAANSGTALSVSGKAKFSRSGVVTIAYPGKSAVVPNVPVTAKSLAFATIQKYLAGVYVVAAAPNLGGSSNSFTIYLNKAPGSSTTPKSVTVAWNLIESP